MTATFTDTLELGSTEVTATQVSQRVRGGGLGARAWVARITGTHPQYGLDRRFLDADRALSGSGRSGTITWDIAGDGIYEYRGLCISSSRTQDGFFQVRDGQVAEITKAEAAAAIA